MMAYSKEFLTGIYKDLLSTRMIEEKLIEIYMLGKVPGHIHSGVGEEAPFVGTLATRNKGDYYKGTHRVVGIVNMLGVTLEEIFAEILGKETGTSHGRGGVNHIGGLDKGIMGTAGSLGCDMVVSVGAGLSSKYLNNGKIVYSYYGDGTSSRGTVHEAMNLAAIWKLPVLFICTNNQFAISAHESATIPVANPGADRASAYGMPAKVVDGTDVLAVYEATQELVKFIREGNGPAVLETKCYRWRGHFEGDQAEYRSKEMTEQERQKCCIKNLEKYLLENEVMTEDDFEFEKKDLAVRLEQAVTFAEESPSPTIEEIYKNLYA